MPRDLRQLAQGQPCMIRVPGVCCHDPAQTVGAHLRLAGITGIGQKAPDVLMAWGCSPCHDYVDGRTHKDVPKEERMLLFYEGMARTQYWLWNNEYLIAVVA